MYSRDSTNQQLSQRNLGISKDIGNICHNFLMNSKKRGLPKRFLRLWYLEGYGNLVDGFYYIGGNKCQVIILYILSLTVLYEDGLPSLSLYR